MSAHPHQHALFAFAMQPSKQQRHRHIVMRVQTGLLLYGTCNQRRKLKPHRRPSRFHNNNQSIWWAFLSSELETNSLKRKNLVSSMCSHTDDWQSTHKRNLRVLSSASHHSFTFLIFTCLADRRDRCASVLSYACRAISFRRKQISLGAGSKVFFPEALSHKVNNNRQLKMSRPKPNRAVNSFIRRRRR